MIALGWVIDEDCLACAGRRREALFCGNASLVSMIGRATATAVLMYGLSWAGLDLANCAEFCKDKSEVSDFEDHAACIAFCDQRNFEKQPEAVSQFTASLYYVFIPICQLVCAVLVTCFPIRGERLDAIYAGIADSYVPVAPRTCRYSGAATVSASDLNLSASQILRKLLI